MGRLNRRQGLEGDQCNWDVQGKGIGGISSLDITSATALGHPRSVHGWRAQHVLVQHSNAPGDSQERCTSKADAFLPASCNHVFFQSSKWKQVWRTGV